MDCFVDDVLCATLARSVAVQAAVPEATLVVSNGWSCMAVFSLGWSACRKVTSEAVLPALRGIGGAAVNASWSERVLFGMGTYYVGGKLWRREWSLSKTSIANFRWKWFNRPLPTVVDTTSSMVTSHTQLESKRDGSVEVCMEFPTCQAYVGTVRDGTFTIVKWSAS